MNFTFDKANERDLPGVLNIYRTSIGQKGCPWNTEYPSEETIRFDMERDALFVLRDEDQEVAGCVSIDDDDEVKKLEFWDKEHVPAAELSRLGVLEKYQNAGLGRRLLDEGTEELKKQGYRAVHFMVYKYNERAIRAYSKSGFSVVGETFMYNEDFICYEKFLDD